MPGIFVVRATSENKLAFVIHIPSKGTKSRVFVVTNNVVFGHTSCSFYMNQSSEGVIDCIPQSASASTADLLPGSISAVDKI